MDKETEFFAESGDTSVPDVQTIEMTDSNEINIPFEWIIRFDLNILGYVQITLVDDRILIHKPTVTDVTYKGPCKAGENSYIRSLHLFSVLVPRRFLKMLNVNNGDKIDLKLEENCVSICKHVNDKSELNELKASELFLAICYLCGRVFNTDGLAKIESKYICPKCVEIIKAF